MPLNNFAIPKEEKKIYPPMPEDVYQVELFDINAREVDDINDKTKKQVVMSFQFVVLEEGEHRGRSIWRDFVPTSLYISKNGKNMLYQIIETLIMRPLKEEEVATMDSTVLMKLIGYQCRVVTKNKMNQKQELKTRIDSLLPKRGVLPGLTDEEKKNATMKPKEGNDSITESGMQQHTQPAPADDLPTINLDEEEPTAPPVAPTVPGEEKELKIEDVPF